MVEPRSASYLAAVKAELRTNVQEIADTDELDVEGITNRLWKFIEPKLKESFMNGRKAGGNGSAKANPFRK